MNYEKVEDVPVLIEPIQPSDAITHAEMIFIIVNRINEIVRVVNTLVSETKKLKEK